SVLFGDQVAIAAMRATLADARVDADARRTALRALLETRPPDLPPLLHRLLADSALRGPALRALAAYNDPKTPHSVLSHYRTFTAAEKADAVSTLASRPAYAAALLDAVEKGQVQRGDVSPFIARQLVAFRDAKLTGRLNKVWGSIRAAPREKAA